MVYVPMLDEYMKDFRLLDNKQVHLQEELRIVKVEKRHLETDMIDILRPVLNTNQRYQCAGMQVWLHKTDKGMTLKFKRIGHKRFKACEICGEPAIENERVCNPCRNDLLNLKEECYER